MSLKTCSTLTAGFALFVLAISLAAPIAQAAASDKHGVVTTHRAHHAYAVRRWHHFTRRVPPAYDIPPNAIRGPGYVFVPGVGILDEACNLPTSSCSNAYRDIQ
jgi:hypothetical protein